MKTMPDPEGGIARAEATPGARGVEANELGRGKIGASVWYRARWWRLGQRVARRVPGGFTTVVLRGLAALYYRTCPARRRVVAANLAPVIGEDPGALQSAVREMFDHFAVKLADLFRYESGQAIDAKFERMEGWEHFLAAQSRGRGVLLVTVHLGNWEFGAPLLTRKGVRLQVITQAEPHSALTELRQAARVRWGVETLPLGEDPFGAIEVVRRLGDNQSVALLMDRPPISTACKVALFGRPFLASVSAAELARATGCAILPVYVPRTERGYQAHLMPEIPYERAALRQPEARQELTQTILRAFEPALRRYATQWYHFVPIWPSASR